jgi:hypothetical protein
MKKEKIIQFLPMVLLLIFVGCAQPNDPLDVTPEAGLSLDHFYPTTGYVLDAAVTEDRLYAAEDQAGFSIFDHQTESIVLDYYEDSYENMRLIQPVEEDSLLFVYVPYGGFNGIRIFDISNTESVQNVATISGQTTDLFDLQTVRHDDGIEAIWSLDNGTNKIMLGGRLALDEASGLWIWTGGITEYVFDFEIGKFDYVNNEIYNHFFICSEQLGVSIYERGEFAPTLVSRFDTQGIPQSVKVVDDFVYVADRQNGLVIADISDITAPEIVAEVATSGYAQDVAIEGNYLALASGGGGVYVFDITDPTNPLRIGRLDDSEVGYTYNVNIQGGKVFAGSRIGVAQVTIQD